MGKRKKKHHHEHWRAHALPPAIDAPRTTTALMVSPRRKRRNYAGGGVMSNKGGVIRGALPAIAGGVASGAALVYGAEALGASPKTAAVGTTLAGGALGYFGNGDVRTLGIGIATGGAAIGAYQYFTMARAKRAMQQQQLGIKRQADGDVVTRQELNDALARVVEQQKQGHCDLVTALREEIKKVIADEEKPAKPAHPVPGDLYSPMRAASGDEERNAGDDDYARNAYGDEDYMRNAYGDFENERNADYDERNADWDERNADEDYLRNAHGEEYASVIESESRNADDERNADWDERNASDEDRNAGDYDEQLHTMTGSSSM
jgi:hypothetical protein